MLDLWSRSSRISLCWTAGVIDTQLPGGFLGRQRAFPPCDQKIGDSLRILGPSDAGGDADGVVDVVEGGPQYISLRRGAVDAGDTD